MDIGAKNELLEDLMRVVPNAYIKIGDEFVPIRTEIIDIWIVRQSLEKGMYHKHNDLPIVLSLEEDERFVFEEILRARLHDTRMYEEFTVEQQVKYLTTIIGICEASEIRNLLKISHSFHPKETRIGTWKALMDFPIDKGLEFLRFEDRLTICRAFYLIDYYANWVGGHNAYDYKRWDSERIYGLNEKDLDRFPLLSKALKFYGVTFEVFHKQCGRKPKRYSGMGPN